MKGRERMKRKEKKNSRRPWSDSLRALRKLALWKGREVERVRGEVRKCDDEVRAERRVKGLVREDMVRFCVCLICFFLGGGGGAVCVYD